MGLYLNGYLKAGILLNIGVWFENINLFIFKDGPTRGSESDEIGYISELFFNCSYMPGVLPSTLHVSSHFLIKKTEAPRG